METLAMTVSCFNADASMLVIVVVDTVAVVIAVIVVAVVVVARIMNVDVSHTIRHRQRREDTKLSLKMENASHGDTLKAQREAVRCFA